jgi:hypothetical protein
MDGGKKVEIQFSLPVKTSLPSAVSILLGINSGD